MGMRCEQTANEKLTKDCAFVKGEEFPCFPPPHTLSPHILILSELAWIFLFIYTECQSLCNRNLLSNYNTDLIELWRSGAPDGLSINYPHWQIFIGV